MDLWSVGTVKILVLSFIAARWCICQRITESHVGEGGTTFDEGTMGHEMPFKYGSSYSHLYDKWSWSREQGRGAAVLETTAHELGHCLGLGHSKGREDLMYYATKDIMFT